MEFRRSFISSISVAVIAKKTAAIMKTSSDRRQKSPKTSRRTGWTRKQSTEAFSAYIYKIEKELSDVSDAVSLMRHLSDAHAQIGAEAARLSKFNRLRVITQRELHIAAKKLLTAEI